MKRRSFLTTLFMIPVMNRLAKQEIKTGKAEPILIGRNTSVSGQNLSNKNGDVFFICDTDPVLLKAEASHKLIAYPGHKIQPEDTVQL